MVCLVFHDSILSCSPTCIAPSAACPAAVCFDVSGVTVPSLHKLCSSLAHNACVSFHVCPSRAEDVYVYHLLLYTELAIYSLLVVIDCLHQSNSYVPISLPVWLIQLLTEASCEW